MDDSLAAELTALSHAWDRGMIENDADAIGPYMADDWTPIGSDGSTHCRNTGPSFYAGVVIGGIAVTKTATTESAGK